MFFIFIKTNHDQKTAQFIMDLFLKTQVNMGNIYFKMGEHPKALKLYRMALDQTPTAEKDLRYDISVHTKYHIIYILI